MVTLETIFPVIYLRYEQGGNNMMSICQPISLSAFEFYIAGLHMRKKKERKRRKTNMKRLLLK
jgi:hypothetical protein